MCAEHQMYTSGLKDLADSFSNAAEAFLVAWPQAKKALTLS